MTAYYNEIEPYAAEWLRNLIAAGHIAPGVVDTRSIEDVHPADLKDFTQCHFFAGIGGWSIALRAAGWSDDRPVWTGSCPCQPFSAAGEGAGFADERHLWPAFNHLIKQNAEWCRQQKRRAPSILGEQVASKDADPWIDLVQADMEALGYAFGSVPFPSASVGAPHIRDRNYWVAHANGGAGGKGRAHVRGRTAGGNAHQRAGSGSGIVLGRLDHREHDRVFAGAADQICELDDAGRSGATNGFWRDADWIFCRDAKWRPVEAGTFPLADGLPAGLGPMRPWVRSLADLAGLDGASLRLAKSYRVGALRGYGNAINPEQAAEFVRIVMEAA